MKLTPTELLTAAERVTTMHFAGSTTLRLPAMIAAIALVESGGQTNAYRFEAHLQEASTGLCQMLHSTAVWLAKDMGYTAFKSLGPPTEALLCNPEIALYFCGAYLIWLSTYKGVPRSVEFVVRGYNGGPNGINLPHTSPYWEKFGLAECAILATQTGGGGDVHVVMPGDNMAKVARQYMISLPEIIALNNEAKPMALRVGQMLRLPQGTTARAMSSIDDDDDDRCEDGEPLDEARDLVRETLDRLRSESVSSSFTSTDTLAFRFTSNSESRHSGSPARAASSSRSFELRRSTHVVRPGEYLGVIASMNGVTVAQLLEENPVLVANPNLLDVGMTVRLPPLGSTPRTRRLSWQRPLRWVRRAMRDALPPLVAMLASSAMYRPLARLFR